MNLDQEIGWLDRRATPCGGHDRHAAHVHTHSADHARWQVRRARERLRRSPPRLAGRYARMMQGKRDVHNAARDFHLRVLGRSPLERT